MPETPAIIVLGYRRLYSLQRLLYSLVQAAKAYQSAETIKLILSLDGGADENVIHFCQNFFSRFFDISVIVHDTKLGVDKHNLWAMEQTVHHDAVMVLEDDTMVSPSLFYYAIQALEFYQKDDTVAGISLYNYERNEVIHYPFFKLHDGFENYFYCKVSSRGLLITRAQWLNFNSFPEHSNTGDLPEVYRHWNDDVWEKKFNRYLIQSGKYCVFPQLSLTTNFGEPGMHVNREIYRHAFQSTMQWGIQQKYSFSNLKQSNAVYDAFGEPVKISGFKTGEITSDIFGIRNLEKVTTKYILTSRRCTAYSEGYALDLKPAELNILHNLRGKDLFVTEVKNIHEGYLEKQQRLLRLHYYFYPDKGLLHLLRLKLIEILNRFGLFKSNKI